VTATPRQITVQAAREMSDADLRAVRNAMCFSPGAYSAEAAEIALDELHARSGAFESAGREGWYE